MEGNDQESIQLPNAFHPRHQGERRTHLKVTAQQSKHYKQKAKRTVSFPNNWPNGYPKYRFYQDMHAETYNDKHYENKPIQID